MESTTHHDTTTLEPLCGEEEFAEILNGMVVDFAPRLFAVVQEYGDRLNGWFAAWGMAFPGHAEVVAVDGGLRMRVQDAESALRVFTAADDDVSARIVWLPAVNSRLEQEPEDLAHAQRV
ncbi:hypothetical protein [Actinosynnema sp. NPDC020468]|uniref:hypothetical protein n=1 Tax=Actinosynnema sp. NPDC020468 TaxID=3154488 RepID=UPI0033DAB1D9